MDKFLLTLILFVLAFNLKGQSEHVHTPNCAHDLMLRGMENKFPGYQDAVKTTFRKAKGNISASRTSTVYTIPVVFHVVWKEEVENISDELIQDQIAVLNEDFRALNTDQSNLRAIFADLAADAMIQFELVAIERVQTTETFGVEIDFLNFNFGFTDETLKNSANGGSSPYDTNSHMNVWVCSIEPTNFLGQEGQILGLAYPPVDLADYPDLNNFPAGVTPDNEMYNGIVVHYPVVGGRDRAVNVPDLGPANFEGRTLVHEVGHYLGLPHIWGNALTMFGEDGCISDDGVDDTPNAGDNSQATGCDPDKNTCDQTVDGDLPDMWENYMDYSLESCQVAFTQGQVDLMRAIIEGPRVGLIGGVSSDAESILSNSISIAPNPTRGLVNLSIQTEGHDEYQVAVRDVMGRLIMNTSIYDSGNQIELDFSAFSEGMYFIEVQKDDVRSTKKIVFTK